MGGSTVCPAPIITEKGHAAGIALSPKRQYCNCRFGDRNYKRQNMKNNT